MSPGQQSPFLSCPYPQVKLCTDASIVYGKLLELEVYE